ncbi:CHAD domain-containing protein [Streptomyces sp. NBC_00199]|uniref:CHAD domain-containing protein n=1 Tax=Streptomyces sp. NBC_00199 TaxID=2975678 RepID=UPI0022520192|nr:CHAD domain-containing protein [Streptomyces sp. NBC_00199]MCX5265054.1 CHAD domain-containing protein [Streptomyces sp. NBC_00199]
MAQRHHDLTASASAAGPVTTGDALEGYLRAQATEFLRALRQHREAGSAASHGTSHSPVSGAEERDDAARALRRSARRISGSLHTFRPLLDAEWSQALRSELSWLSATLALEHAYGARLERLLLALNRLSGAAPQPTAALVPPPAAAPAAPGTPGVPATPSAPGDPVLPGPPPHPISAATAPTAADARTARGAGGPQGGTLTAAPTGTGARTTTASRADTASTASRADTAPRAAGARPAAARPATPSASSTASAPADRGNLTVGAAKAGALLDRQLTLARTRAHSTALQALGSSRFHAVADRAAVLASEVPLTPAASATDLRPFAAAAEERLADAVAALPLITAGSPYNAEALIHGLSADAAPHPQDAPWHHVRLLLRLHRYACEVLGGPDAAPDDVRLPAAGAALDRHRDASEAAAAAAQAARTPRIAPATAYALGVLHADQRHEVEAARYAFQRSWQRHPVTTT